MAYFPSIGHGQQRKPKVMGGRRKIIITSKGPLLSNDTRGGHREFESHERIHGEKGNFTSLVLFFKIRKIE